MKIGNIKNKALEKVSETHVEHEEDDYSDYIILHPIGMWKKGEGPFDKPVQKNKRPKKSEDMLNKALEMACKAYAGRVSGNDIAIQVKMRDLKDNMDKSCLGGPKHEKMTTYRWAYGYLQKELKRDEAESITDVIEKIPKRCSHDEKSLKRHKIYLQTLTDRLKQEGLKEKFIKKELWDVGGWFNFIEKYHSRSMAAEVVAERIIKYYRSFEDAEWYFEGKIPNRQKRGRGRGVGDG